LTCVLHRRHPPEVQTIVRNGDVANLTKKIARVQNEINQIDAEIQQLESQRPGFSEPPARNLTSLAQWLDVYGRSNPPPNGFFSEFERDPKIYGGTAHHRGLPLHA
jgi:septal ring factor EnvC (AmiA/AmiB activator)